MEVNKKQLADIFGASIRTIQNWQEQGMPVLREQWKSTKSSWLTFSVRVSVPFRTGRSRECPFCEAVGRVMRCFMTLPPS
ncbi:terminase small subunit [Escherichia coli]|uniref:terminase small subunit n=1 Tax=Escherichia coli TaxID=562 RepID=UPI003B9B5218